MNAHDLQMGEMYRITADDKRKNRVGKAVGLVEFGDVIIKFKSGATAEYHPVDLEPV